MPQKERERDFLPDDPVRPGEKPKPLDYGEFANEEDEVLDFEDKEGE